MAEKLPVTALLTVPGVTCRTFRRDWLHAVDQGVAADFMGSSFKELLKLMPGRNVKVRCQELFQYITAWYDVHDVKDRLVGLRPGGIQQSRKPPKLKGNAATVRALVPFLKEACDLHLDQNDPKHKAMPVSYTHLRAHET